MNENRLYDIVFIGIIIMLIVLYVIFSKKPTVPDQHDEIIEEAVSNNIDDLIIRDDIQTAIKQQNAILQEGYNVSLLEGDDYNQIDTSSLPWDTGIECESENQFDSSTELATNNLYGRRRTRVMF